MDRVDGMGTRGSLYRRVCCGKFSQDFLGFTVDPMGECRYRECGGNGTSQAGETGMTYKLKDSGNMDVHLYCERCDTTEVFQSEAFFDTVQGVVEERGYDLADKRDLHNAREEAITILMQSAGHTDESQIETLDLPEDFPCNQDFDEAWEADNAHKP